jgi:2-oxoisovalerate dehydrogenase E1 component beta subunit
MALGASLLKGLWPIVEFQYADFASEAFKIIVNCAATQIARGAGPFHIVFRLPSGWAKNASMFHCVNPESWFASTPGLKIVSPITSFDAKGLFKAALRDGNPTLFLEYKDNYGIDPENLPQALNTPIPDDDYVVPIGRARILKEGTDCTIISYGSQIFCALEAALCVEQKQNVSIEVIDLRSLVPFDIECLARSIKKTSRALITCQAPRTGCFGQTIAHELHERAFTYLDAPIRLVAAADTPVPFSEILERAHLPTTEKIVHALQNLLTF